MFIIIIISFCDNHHQLLGQQSSVPIGITLISPWGGGGQCSSVIGTTIVSYWGSDYNHQLLGQ